MQLFGRKRKRMLRHGKAFVAQNMEGSKKKDAKKRRGEYKCFIVHTDKWPKCDSIVNFWPHCAAATAVESEAVGAATMQLYALIPAQFNDSGRSQCNLHA